MLGMDILLICGLIYDELLICRKRTGEILTARVHDDRNGKEILD